MTELNSSFSSSSNSTRCCYRGRLAPTPSGKMHLGHAQTFYIAWKRAQENNGTIILRIEDLDQGRCRSHFLEEFLRDLEWFGITWSEGPQTSNLYFQSQRHDIYLQTWKILYQNGFIYPSKESRRQILAELSSISSSLATSSTTSTSFTTTSTTSSESTISISAPHEENNISAEPIFPEKFRLQQSEVPKDLTHPGNLNWRFRVPDGRIISYHDNRCGEQHFTCGEHFGDFLVWRNDGFPSYELAVVVDDLDMKITEVVRGEDLLLSTARQILLYEALGFSTQIPLFFHCPLVRDENGTRLAKRTSPLATISHLRENGYTPERIRSELLPNLANI